MVAAVGGVLGESGALELVRFHHLDPGADAAGEVDGRLPLAARHRHGDGRERLAAVTEHVMGHPQQERRIHAARKADQRRFVPGQDVAQPGVLVLYRLFHGCGHGQCDSIAARTESADLDAFAAGDGGGYLGGDVELGFDALGVGDAGPGGGVGRDEQRAASSKGRIDVSYVPMRRASAVVSTLS